ncbi:MAG: SDR family oxidoreductase [Saprospiraceae bacterium]
MNKALITGGTGVLGTTLVRAFQQNHLDFLTVSRTGKRTQSYTDVTPITKLPWKRADLLTGEGLHEALIGVDTVIHLASVPGGRGKEMPEVTMMRHLMEASRMRQVQHLIYISIVGVDRVPLPYYRSKWEAEQLLQASGIPYTILRATQFHEFVDFMIGQLMRLPIGLVPKKLKIQPISLEAVTHALVQIAEGNAQNRVLNLGGREVLDMGTMVRLWQQYQGVSKPILPLPNIGQLMHTIAKGYLTCPENRALASTTWEAYLAQQYSTNRLAA